MTLHISEAEVCEVLNMPLAIEAVEEISRQRGRTFDPCVVDAFLRVLPQVLVDIERASNPDQQHPIAPGEGEGFRPEKRPWPPL